jgi:hypothetical protein
MSHKERTKQRLFLPWQETSSTRRCVSCRPEKHISLAKICTDTTSWFNWLHLLWGVSLHMRDAAPDLDQIVNLFLIFTPPIQLHEQSVDSPDSKVLVASLHHLVCICRHRRGYPNPLGINLA